MSGCPHCDGGHTSEFRPETNEHVHRWAPTASNGGRFTITLCGPKTREAQGKITKSDTVPVRRDLLAAYEQSNAMLQAAVADPEAGPLLKQAFGIVKGKEQP